MFSENATVIKDISQARHQKEATALYNVIDVADWYSTTFYIANILNIPLGPSLVDQNLSLIKNTLPQRLGHRNLGEFITSPRTKNGLEIIWNEWKDNVKAARYKQEFGINSNDRDDILAQVEDVKIVIGRLPISSNEFNHGKDIIEASRIHEIEKNHKSEIESMHNSVKGLMHQLSAEQKERHQAIERMNDALMQLGELKKKQELKDEMHNEVMADYVKRSMYEKIIEQMEVAEVGFEESTQEYLDRILQLEQERVSLSHSLKTIKDKHARLLEKLSNQEALTDNNATKDEIVKLKIRLAELLKAHITEKKKNQKLHIISNKQQKLLEHFRKKNQRAKSISDDDSKKNVNIFLFSVLSIASISLLSLSYLGLI